MKKYFVFWIVAFLLLCNGEALAFNISIDVTKVKEKVRPGETVRAGVTLKNPSQEPIEVKVYVEDFAYISPFDGSKKFFPPGSTKFSASKWISFSPQEIILPPFGKKRVNYAVNVPQGVSGGYYAVLFFETSLGALPDAEGASILLLGRVGCLFFIETEDSLKLATVGDITADGNKLNGKLINQGNTFLVSKGSFYVLDKRGQVFDRGKIADLYISPDDQAPFSLTLTENLPPGRYILFSSFDLEDGDILAREVDFSKDKSGKITILQIRE